MPIKPAISAEILPEQADGTLGDVVLIHGLAASRCDWTWLAPELRQAGYRTIALDLPGHGDSVKPGDPSLYTVSTMYVLLEDWLDGLKLDRPFVMIGHSLGGNLSLRYARRHPDRLAGLVLVDPFYSQSQVNPLMRALFRRPHLAAYGMQNAPAWLVNALIGLDPFTVNNFPANVKRQISQDYLRSSPQIMYLPPTGGELLNTLHEVCLKTLVIWGERDLTLNPRSFPALVRRMPCAQGHSVANCGHQPHLTRPDVVDPLVVRFLGKLGGEGDLPADLPPAPSLKGGRNGEPDPGPSRKGGGVEDVQIVQRGKIFHVPAGQSLQQALDRLKLPAELYLAIRAGELLQADEILAPGDQVRLVGVVSGG